MPETVKTHLWLIGSGTVLSALSLVSIVSFTDPYTTGKLTHFFFYISLFLFTLGLFSLIGIFARQRFQKGLYIIHLSASFRQALFIAIFITASVILSVYGLLFWWVEAGLILFFFVVEMFLNL